MSTSEEFAVVTTQTAGEVNVDYDRTQLLEEEMAELRTELHVKEAEFIQTDMELTMVKSEAEDLKAELARVKALHAKTEHDRKRAIAKYNHLLDEMRSSPTEMEANLAEYRRKADDLEDQIEKQRAAWQETGVFLKNQTIDAEDGTHNLRDEINQLNKSLEDERKKVGALSVDLETAHTQSQEWERQAKDAELKLASAGNTHSDVVDMYRQQSEELRRMATVNEDEESTSFEQVAGEDKQELVIAQ